MSNVNIRQRLSGTKRLQVGPNDARRFIQGKHIKPLSSQRFDARDFLRNTSKAADAREKLNKIKRKPIEKEQPSHKKIKSLMQSPIQNVSRTSLKNGALIRTVKSSSKVQTNLTRGTLTRTLKGIPKHNLAPKPNLSIKPKQYSPIQRNGSSLSRPTNRSRDIQKAPRVKAEYESSVTRKRKRVPEIWDTPLESRRSASPQANDSSYRDYESVKRKPARLMQQRSNTIPVQVSRPYQYEEPLTLLPDNDFSASRSVDRSYRPSYEILRPEESRQFREFLQQQELQRNIKLQEDMLELEARRRSSMMDFELSEKRYFQSQNTRRLSPGDEYSLGHEVIVSNLIPVIHESEIDSCFHQFGNVLGIEFIDKTTARIKYENENDAKVAALYLDNKEIPVIFGTSYIGTQYSKQRISVRLPPKAATFQPNRTYMNTSKPVQSNRSYLNTSDQVQPSRSYVEVSKQPQPSRTFYGTPKSTIKSFSSNEKTQSFRDVATFVRPRSTLARPPPLLARQYPSRQVQPDIHATHSALFNSRSVQMSAQQKSFLVRRM